MTVTGTISGTAVTQSASDSTAARLLKTGDGGVLGNAVALSGTAALHARNLRSGQYIGAANVVAGLPEALTYFHTVSLSRNGNSGGIYSGLSIRNSGNPAAQKIWFGSGGGSESAINWTELWHGANTTVDANGFLKQASPIVRLFDDGTEEPVQIVDAKFEKHGTGVYSLGKCRPIGQQRLADRGSTGCQWQSAGFCRNPL